MGRQKSIKMRSAAYLGVLITLCKSTCDTRVSMLKRNVYIVMYVLGVVPVSFSTRPRQNHNHNGHAHSRFLVSEYEESSPGEEEY